MQRRLFAEDMLLYRPIIIKAKLSAPTCTGINNMRQGRLHALDPLNVTSCRNISASLFRGNSINYCDAYIKLHLSTVIYDCVSSPLGECLPTTMPWSILLSDITSILDSTQDCFEVQPFWSYPTKI